jgi:hypothetical protein
MIRISLKLKKHLQVKFTKKKERWSGAPILLNYLLQTGAQLPHPALTQASQLAFGACFSLFSSTVTFEPSFFENTLTLRIVVVFSETLG